MTTSSLAAALFWICNAIAAGAISSLSFLSVREALTTATVCLRVPDDVSSVPSLRKVAAKRGLLIGAATEAVPLVREPDFASLLGNQFSMLATENRMKFNIIHPERERYDFTQADVIVKFAQANQMAVRGHCFVWHEHFPGWLNSADIPTTIAEQIVREHIETVMRRYAGKVAYWDVVNEAISDDGHMRETKWKSLLGEDYIAKAFRWSRVADPNAKLFLNDFGIEAICPKSDKFYEVVRQLLADKVPIDGLGFQMHLNLAAGLSTASLQLNLKRFASLGLELHITEMDVSLAGPGVTTGTLLKQGQMYREVLEAALQFPEFKALVFWGASDRHSWLTGSKQPPDAPLLFDNDLCPKPAYFGVLQAIRPH
jgi:endo-1,4-beta-xylanase